jgi:hypothetical protein
MFAGLVVLIIECLFADRLLKKQWSRRRPPGATSTDAEVNQNA